MNLHGANASYKLWVGVGHTELHCIIWVRCDYRSSQHVSYLTVWQDIWWRSRLFKSVKSSYFATVHCSHAPQIKLLSHLHMRSKNCEKQQLTSSCLPVRLSACPPVRLSACPPVRLSACPPVRLSACPSKLPHETTQFSLDGYSQYLMRIL
jgi:hypothetical protein